jgi:hypothetical protein
MGAGPRSRSTTREAFEAEARRQEERRPPSRPRPPPIANKKHTAPLWSEHLQTYVSYSWEEHQWKRWSTTAKLWKVILDINVVIRAESRLHEDALQGVRTMPQKPQEPGWSDPLWYQAEKLFVSYNSGTGKWKEWSENYKEWEQAHLSEWPEMPVSSMAIEEKNEEPPNTQGKTSQKTEGIKSQETAAASPLSVVAVQNPLAAIDLAEGSQKATAAPSASKMAFERLLKLLRHPFTRQKSTVPRKRR